jgi:RNA polymerase sigma factor (sigma-70 family)
MAYYSATDDISFILLTPEQEIELFERFYSTGDLAARDIIITNHLKLVAKLALQVSAKGGIPDEDAISAANFALVKAVESRCFKPNIGIRFATYVRKYVYGQVIKALRERMRGFESDASPMAHANCATVTGVHSDYLEEFRFGAKHDREKLLLDNKVSEPATIESDDLSRIRREKLLEAIKELPEPERLALTEHYFRDKNFADIARRRNSCRAVCDKKRTTREGIRKAHNRGIAKLKCVLAKLEKELN